MLHTVNKSPFADTALESCLRFVSEGDAVLLLEDGVYAAAGSTTRSAMIESVLQHAEVYAIAPDVEARGITGLIPGVKLASYADFVKLLEQHNTQAWL